MSLFPLSETRTKDKFEAHNVIPLRGRFLYFLVQGSTYKENLR